MPGPFLESAAEAWADYYRLSKEPADEDVRRLARVLVIEELNRANAASVFGDMFQVLDRGSDGISEYGVTLPDEMRVWLEKKLTDERVDADDAKQLAKDFKLPPNLFLWATMNSADQGVFPLDSAFKRRWSFLYKSVEDGNRSKTISLPHSTSPELWETFRAALNAAIVAADPNIEEDRLIGSWFLTDEELAQIENYYNANLNRSDLPNPLCDKLFSYLRQDVFRNNPGAFFANGYRSLSQLRAGLKGNQSFVEMLAENVRGRFSNLNLQQQAAQTSQAHTGTGTIDADAGVTGDGRYD